ncbi:predicted protein [Phaeodactylum tricornutum CCAP 1055/1]|jgi:ornithine cyclodeaminase|uniref:Ornithine cyclodeaminase n=1 Tax=Phaeodactylum tricornutum (strain CCAP 1055/1) TaxID=556484 RepID=B7FYV2_PHATC|nr:predicted protein [Phaeodactylum tricornutum CCAP 1055/1]EEC48235.1 predicted protein [Phaeodactylum tricornutum CCAP 1055/1]|eukprot:XP_002180044.1 predicted protein [Phaeodactylum tricornutum CCAP 1055/1]
MSASSQTIPDLYTLDQIQAITDTATFRNDLIKAISQGFVAFENGLFVAAPIQTLGAPPTIPFVANHPNYAAQTCVKSGYFAQHPYYVIKVASGGTPWPNSGLLQVYSQRTGRLEALLLDEGVLTELRTAAVGALAAQLLAPKCILRIGVLGTGVQARYQLLLLQSVTECREVLVWGRNRQHTEKFQAEMKHSGWKVEIATAVDDLLSKCDLVLTTTCAREAILGKSVSKLSKKGQLIVCIGSDAPGKRELSDVVLNTAELLVADHVPQSRERGEFQYLDSSKVAGIIPFGALIGQPEFHRKDSGDDRTILFDSSGVALQDCVIAQMVYDALQKARTL